MERGHPYLEWEKPSDSVSHQCFGHTNLYLAFRRRRRSKTTLTFQWNGSVRILTTHSNGSLQKPPSRPPQAPVVSSILLNLGSIMTRLGLIRPRPARLSGRRGPPPTPTRNFGIPCRSNQQRDRARLCGCW